MTLNVNKYKRKRGEATKRADIPGVFRLADGRNIVRVFLFQHKVTKADFERGQYQKDETKIGRTETELDVAVLIHYIGERGRVVCPGAGCPICADVAKMRSSSSTQDKERARRMAAAPSWHLNVVDVQDVKRGMTVMRCSKMVYKEIQRYVLDEEFGEAITGPTGRDFIIDRFPDAQPSERYRTVLRDPARCKKLSAKTLEPMDLLLDKELWPGFGLKDYAGPGVEEAEPETAVEPSGYDDNDPLRDWQEGDRVIVAIDGDDYAGIVDKIVDAKTCTINFDDGDVMDIEREDMRMEGANDDDPLAGLADDGDDDFTGKTVVFTDDSGEECTGEAVEASTKHEGEFIVDVGGDLFSVPANLLKIAPASSKPKRIGG